MTLRVKDKENPKLDNLLKRKKKKCENCDITGMLKGKSCEM